MSRKLKFLALSALMFNLCFYNLSFAVNEIDNKLANKKEEITFVNNKIRRLRKDFLEAKKQTEDKCINLSNLRTERMLDGLVSDDLIKHKVLTDRIRNINKSINSIKEDQERRKKLGLSSFVKLDNEKIEKLEQEKLELKEELFLLY